MKNRFSGRHDTSIVSFSENSYFRAPRNSFFSDFRKIAIQGVMKEGFFGFPKIRFFSAPGKIDFSLSEK